MIYVDNNATTAVAPEVRDVMLPFFNELYYNPSSMYPPAQNVAKEVKKARQTIAQFLDIEDPSEILFTSCASESNNAAILARLRRIRPENTSLQRRLSTRQFWKSARRWNAADIGLRT